jgi:acyl carrier protein
MTTMDDIKGRCRKVFAEILKVEPSVITDDSSPDTLEEWDSLAHVQLILDLEKKLSVTIHPDESVDLENFQMVTDLIGKKLNVIS